jgi:hypothetical protein
LHPYSKNGEGEKIVSVGEDMKVVVGEGSRLISVFCKLAAASNLSQFPEERRAQSAIRQICTVPASIKLHTRNIHMEGVSIPQERNK